MAYLQIPSLTNPLVSPWDEFVASGATQSSTGLGPLGYLGLLSLLLNPPMGPSTNVAQTEQGAVVQEQPWGASAASGGLQGAMTGSLFGWPGAAIGGAAGYGLGSGIQNDLTWKDIGGLLVNPFMAPTAILGGRK